MSETRVNRIVPESGTKVVVDSDFEVTGDVILPGGILVPDPDITLGGVGSSDNKTPTQLAVKTYIDNEVALIIPTIEATLYITFQIATINSNISALQSAVSQLQTDIGTVGSLTTTATNLTSAVNELDAEIGNLATLTTAVTTDLVSAINSIVLNQNHFIPDSDSAYDLGSASYRWRSLFLGANGEINIGGKYQLKYNSSTDALDINYIG